MFTFVLYFVLTAINVYCLVAAVNNHNQFAINWDCFMIFYLLSASSWLSYNNGVKTGKGNV